jgi:hypothetical protein
MPLVKLEPTSRSLEKQDFSAERSTDSATVTDADAVGADVDVADVLAAGAFGPGLPQSTGPRHAGSPGLPPLTHPAQTDALERHWYYPLPADTMRFL